jgi:hypothetical protein
MSELTTLSCTELIARIESLENGLANDSRQLSHITEGLTADSWYRSEVEKSTVLSELCEILGVQPTQTVSITATLTVCMSHEVPLDELEDFDADQLVSDLYLVFIAITLGAFIPNFKLVAFGSIGTFIAAAILIQIKVFNYLTTEYLFAVLIVTLGFASIANLYRHYREFNLQ